jgi:hypothetical protein
MALWAGKALCLATLAGGAFSLLTACNTRAACAGAVGALPDHRHRLSDTAQLQMYMLGLAANRTDTDPRASRESGAVPFQWPKPGHTTSDPDTDQSSDREEGLARRAAAGLSSPRPLHHRENAAAAAGKEGEAAAASDAKAVARVSPAPAEGANKKAEGEQKPGGAGAAAGDDAAAAKLPEEAVENPYEGYGDMTQFSRTRQICVRISCNPDFEMLVTLIIFANCLTLCLYDPMQPETNPHNKALYWTGEGPRGLGRRVRDGGREEEGS